MSAGLQTTQPLALGIQLEAGSASLSAEAFSVPITLQSANLVTSASSADVGTSWPLIVGLTLSTLGSSTFTLTAGAFSTPITMQSATLSRTYEPADVQIFPLALGLLLTDQDYTLTAEAFTVDIVLAPSESDEFSEAAVGGYRPGGITRTPQLATGSRKQMEAELFKQSLPTVKPTKQERTPLEKRIQPVVEDAFTEEEMLLLL